VVARIQSLRVGAELQAVGSQFKEWKDFCVLYRANHLAKPFEKAFRKANIPYKVSGGQSFFDRAEIKDLCSWMVLLTNNDNNPAFIRAVKTPKRGIGHTTLGALSAFADTAKLSLFESLFSHSLGSVLPAKAVGSLQEFGRYLNDLEYRAKRCVGFEAARVFLTEWLKEIDYEKHLYDGEESEKVAAARWSNVMDFCDWVAQRCGGQITDAAGVAGLTEVMVEKETKTMLEVVQTIALLSTISEREGEQNVVTLSTLHAAKGLEWPHVVLAGVNEGLLPFKLEDDDGTNTENLAQRLQEERRLMYVGITRAQRTLAVNWLRKRKKGRDLIAGVPSRFIGEMALDQTTVKEDPREKIKALRAEFARKSAEGLAAAAAAAKER
jgi:ATP-dependent DNA helicase Rep